MFDLNESSSQRRGKKPNKTNLLHGNTEVVGVLSGREEIREGRLTIQCLKTKLLSFSFFFPQFILNMFV